MDAITLSFRYDGLSRRISKKVTITKNGVASSTMEGYLYDGWNPVMITQLNAAASSETVLIRKWSCLWRPDVGSSLYARTSWQKAGGVGGLAWLQTGAAQTLATDNLFSLQGTCEIHIPMADHMGNIRNYIHARATTVNDGSGPYAMVNYTPSANFEYDAFGREVRANGTTVAATNTPPGLTAGTAYADALPFHFSSKFTDPESGLNYYGYRFYDPKDGRWLGRDPIEEEGGMNLYGMLANDPVKMSDILGLMICCTKTITTAEILYPMMSSASGAADAKRWSMSKCVIERLKELEPGLYESLKNSDYLALTGLGSNTLAGAASTIGTAATGTGAVQDGINNVKNLPSKPTPPTKAAKISLASSATSSVVGGIANLTKMIPIFEYCNKKWCLKTVPSVWSVNIFKGCKKCPAGSTEMDDADLYPANSPK